MPDHLSDSSLMPRDLGEPVPEFRPPPRPEGAVLEGRYARLEPLTSTHVPSIHAANTASDQIWDYLPYGPFDTVAHYDAWRKRYAAGPDPFFYAIQDLDTGQWAGVAAFMRIKPEAGSIEVGNINFAPALQHSRAGTEAMFLMMRWAFTAGYRRYEWKCNALNMGSRRAAERYGFSYEGVFRQALVVKGRNRDTAWFAMIDKEWPAIRQAFEIWLDPSNFDASGQQMRRLSTLTGPILVKRDPSLG